MTKYRNKPTQIGNEKYRSQKEAKRHQDLLLLEKVGHISALQREVPYVLVASATVKGRTRPAVRYYADFVYVDKHGKQVVEDCKGMRTAVYNLKRHLMKVVHGVDIHET